MSAKGILAMLGLIAVIASILLVIPTHKRGELALEHVRVVNWNSVVDDPSRKLTISWMGIAAYPSARDGSWIQRRLEREFNIKLKPYFLDWGSFTNRRPMMFCGGDIPDVFWDGDPLGVRINVKNGFVMELPYKLLLKYCPIYVREVNAHGRQAWLYSYWRGKNWGIPTFVAMSGGETIPRAGVWRKDWLDKVGIKKVPDTVEEMHEAFRRFTFDDPDGDGENDTYGYCPEVQWSLSFADVFAAYGILPADFMVRDGEVVWGGTVPEAKNVLRVLRSWYKEGIIDPDYVAGDHVGGGPGQKFINGRVGYCYDQSEFSRLDLNTPQSIHSMTKALNPKAIIVPSKPLMGFDGKRRGRTWGGSAHVIQLGKHLEKEPRKVIRILKMLEALTTNEALAREARMGKRDLHWEWSPDRGVYLLPPYNGATLANQEMLSNNSAESGGFFAPSSMPTAMSRQLLAQGVLEFRATYQRPEWGTMNVLGKSDVVDSASDYLEDLRQFQATAFAEMIRGDRDLSYFDTFVKLWRQRGGDVLTREANEMYGTMQNIYRQVGVTSQPSAARGKR